jgi:hypothetical protein
MARRKKGAVTGRTWLIRAGIGLGAGLLLGFIIGAITVRVLQPPAVPDADVADTSVRKPVADASPAEADRPAPDPGPSSNGTLVPKLIGLEEGDARNLILRTGFAVGSVTFKASSAPIGTGVESIPIPGEAIVLPATISLILSDGKGRVDSLPAHPSFP